MPVSIRKHTPQPRSTLSDNTRRRLSLRQAHFLDQITIDYGPLDTFGRFFVRAYNEALLCGCTLEFSNLHTLLQTNAQNRDSWSRILPIFDPDLSEACDEECISLVARDNDRRIVCTQAIRRFDITENLCDATESLELFYGGGAEAARRETAESWAVSGDAREVLADMSGVIAYSGAAWCCPMLRGGHLTRLLVRVCRAYAIAKWKPDFVVTFMAEKVVDSGFAEKVGHRHIEWAVEARDASVGDVRAAFLWLTPEESIEDIERFLDRPVFSPPLELDRSAEHERFGSR